MAVLAVGHCDDTVLWHGERQGHVKLCRHHFVRIGECNRQIHGFAHISHNRIYKQTIVCPSLSSRPSRECHRHDERKEA